MIAGVYRGVPGWVVEVRDFGAVGDGVTDDRAAIQLAIDDAAAKGKRVHFGAGTFFVNRTDATPYFDIPSNIEIFGEGRETTIFLGGTPLAGAHLFNIDGTSATKENIIIRDLKLDGDNAAAIGLEINAVRVRGDANNIEAKNLWIDSWPHTALYAVGSVPPDVFYSVNRIKFSDNSITNWKAGAAIYFFNGVRFSEISRNILAGSANDLIAIGIETDAGTPVNCYDCRVVSNTISMSGLGTTYSIYLIGTGNEECIVQENTSTSNGTTVIGGTNIQCVGNSFWGAGISTPAGSSSITIVGNNLSACTSYSISCASYFTIITNNSIANSGNSAVYLNGTVLGSCIKTIVSNNHIAQTSAGDGVHVDGSGGNITGLIISNNIIIAPNDYAINVDGADGAIISNNSCYRFDGSIEDIDLDAGSVNCVINNNHAAVYFNGNTNCSAAGNFWTMASPFIFRSDGDVTKNVIQLSNYDAGASVGVELDHSFLNVMGGEDVAGMRWVRSFSGPFCESSLSIDLLRAGSAVEVMQLIGTDLTDDGYTSMLLMRNSAGDVTLQPVTLGINDSGGAGYRLLRVPQ